MKNVLLLFFLIAACILSACSKNYVTNNYTTPNTAPPFRIEGLNNIVLINNYTVSAYDVISAIYQDSDQQSVSLSLSGLPPGVVMDTTWIKNGVPTFKTYLKFYDTTMAGAIPGTYKLTLTAISASGEINAYPLDLIIQHYPTAYLGKYTLCTTSCMTSPYYTDSVYTDPAIPGKIWFTNFANTGIAVYGMIDIGFSYGALTIPEQLIGPTTYSGGCSVYLTEHSMDISIYIGGTTDCFVNMN